MSEKCCTLAGMKSVGLLLDRKFVTKLNRLYKNRIVELGDKDTLYAKGHLKWGLKHNKYWNDYTLVVTFVIDECTWRWKYHWNNDYKVNQIYKGDHNRLRVRSNFELDLIRLGQRNMKLWGANHLDVNVSLSFPSPPSKPRALSSKG